jgi:membrane-associated protein
MLETLIDLFLHFDRHLAEFVVSYGGWVYGLLFLIIFAETGLVVTPFLPGDSLLFAVGALAATGAMNPVLVTVLLMAAAFIGNAVNYSIGRYVGPRVFHAQDQASGLHKLLNREHLDRAHTFFEKHGGMAVVLARFVPIVRTFVPFVAGAASMSYPAFAFYNLVGCIAWVALCIGAGFAFGNVPIVKDNFSVVALGIVAVSVMPIVIEYLRSRNRARSGKPAINADEA